MIDIERDKIVQIKIMNGQDVLAVSVEENPETFMVNYALDMVPLEYEDEESEEVKSYYVLRPFVAYTANLDQVVGINPLTVVCVNAPSDAVIEQYLSSITKIQEMLSVKEPAAPVADSTGNVVSLSSRKKLLTED
jgi:hypothetical protein